MLDTILAAWMSLAIGTAVANDTEPRNLTFEDRVTAQKAIEQVYWNHRIWPKDNPQPKPPLSAVMSDGTLRSGVEDYLRKSNALETWWRRPITAEQLQAELDRMARGSRDPRVLQELFHALHEDAFLIVETLVRPILADRLLRNRFASDDGNRGASQPAQSFDVWWNAVGGKQSTRVESFAGPFVLPALSAAGCVNDVWSPTFTDVPDGRSAHTAVWTGTEMIVWGGGGDGTGELNTGGRYNPSTDTWIATSIGAHVPYPRFGHTAVWTGTEMIVWGGWNYHTGGSTPPYLNDGGRYDPVNDTWSPTSTGANVPAGRFNHTAVWTGTEMIVWGGTWNDSLRITGGRYNPVTNSWLPTSTGANVPSGRSGYSVVWSGTEMIVWGGLDYWTAVVINSGARYAPSTDSWTPTPAAANVPASRMNHSAVWTGTEMIVWGGKTYGQFGGPESYFNSGGRFSPSTNSWIGTSIGVDVPSPRFKHTAFWTGSKMIVWGGTNRLPLTTGAIYEPLTDSWVATTASPLQPRSEYSAVWTGTEMIVWGGRGGLVYLSTGGRFDPMSGSWVATSTATNVPQGRYDHTAVWTGTEMIVWGGIPGGVGSIDHNNPPTLNSGSRYSPATDNWRPTSVNGDVPTPRHLHTAVWTGKEMVVWGGHDGTLLQSGGRYNPITDSWIATSMGESTPSPRQRHSAVWTGKQMIIWGSGDSGGRYDPAIDTWTPVATPTNAPTAVDSRAAVWTGTTMIVWGYAGGGIYDPFTDAWTPVSAGANAPIHRLLFTVAWTGAEMIVWGGSASSIGDTNTGSRYNPFADSWTPTSTGTSVASPRSGHTAAWTGSEMIVWGGAVSSPSTPNGGGRYSPTTDSWTAVSMGAYVPFSRYYQTAVWTGAEMIVWGGEPNTNTGFRYCACPTGRLLYRDADGDGYGDPGVSIESCDGSIPAGYATDSADCNDGNPSVHPGATEACNGIDDNCDGRIDEDASGADSDGDGVRNLCDNCPFVSNATQSDFDHDGQGDACDFDDGLIYIYSTDKNYREWQAESGYTTWNSYRGSLSVLRATGQYTQAPDSNPLAAHDCKLTEPYVFDPLVPDPGDVAFNLVTGVAGGVENSLGTNSAGVPRANANPCP